MPNGLLYLEIFSLVSSNAKRLSIALLTPTYIVIDDILGKTENSKRQVKQKDVSVIAHAKFKLI